VRKRKEKGGQTQQACRARTEERSLLRQSRAGPAVLAPGSYFLGEGVDLLDGGEGADLEGVLPGLAAFQVLLHHLIELSTRVTASKAGSLEES
jgi:hypothetical protein